MIDNNYCLKECNIGKKYKEEILQKQDSVFDAVEEINEVLNVCTKTCDKNCKIEEVKESGREQEQV